MLKKADSTLSRILGGGGGRGGSSGRGGGLGGAYKFITETEDTLQLQAKNINILGENVGVIATNFAVQAEQILLTSLRVDETGAALLIEKDRITAEVTARNEADNLLSGKINVEKDRITAEVTRSEGVEELLSGRLTITEGAITQEVTDRTSADNTLQGKINVEKDRITAEVTRATGEEVLLSGRLTITEGAITQEVTDRTTADNTLQGKINVEAGKITAEVSRATTAEGALSSRLTITEDNIELKVDKSGVITAINVAPGTVTINASKLNISGIVTAGGLALDGDLSATNALISNLRAGNSGFTSISTNDIQTIGATITGSMSVAGNISGAINISGIFGKFSSVYEAGELLSDRYLGKTAKAADSNRLNGELASKYALWTGIDTMMANYSLTTHDHNAAYLGKTAKAANSDLLDGYHYDAFSFAGHTHDYAASSHGHAIGAISGLSRTSAQFVTDVSRSVTTGNAITAYSAQGATYGTFVKTVTLSVTKNTYYFYT